MNRPLSFTAGVFVERKRALSYHVHVCQYRPPPIAQHQYHNQIETNLERIQRKMAIVLNEKMGSVLEGHLAKLARYDANTLLSSVLSLAVSP